jgi:hypothetical protein
MTTTRKPAAIRFQPIDPQPDALPMPKETDKTLAQIRTEAVNDVRRRGLGVMQPPAGWLRDTDVASHALKVGDTAPDLLLPDADRRLRSSEQLRRNGVPDGVQLVRLGRLRHSGMAQRSVALCNPFPIVISRRPRRAIPSQSSRPRSRARNRE